MFWAGWARPEHPRPRFIEMIQRLKSKQDSSLFWAESCLEFHQTLELLRAAQARVERIAQAVAKEVEGEHGNGQRHRGEDGLIGVRADNS